MTAFLRAIDAQPMATEYKQDSAQRYSPPIAEVFMGLIAITGVETTEFPTVIRQATDTKLLCPNINWLFVEVSG